MPEEIEGEYREVTEEEPVQYQTGYRAWKLGFRKGSPRLLSLMQGITWEPGEEGEISSDWEGEEEEGHPFSQSSKGLYSLSSLKEVREHGYGGEEKSLLGSIIPYGEVVHGEYGYRSSKAKVRSIFRGPIPCFICKRPARWVLRNDDRFTLCDRCYTKVRKLAERKNYTTEELEAVLQKLAEIYEAEVVDYPEELG